MNATMIPITDVCAAVVSLTGERPPFGHRQLQQAAADARLPTARRLSRVWHVEATAIPAVVQAMALSRKPGRPRIHPIAA